MKLSKRILLHILVPVALIVTLWSVGFCRAMIDEVNDEVDDALDEYAEQLIRRQLRGEEVPTEDNATNNSYYFEEIDPADVGKAVRYSDEIVWIDSKDEFEPARVLRTEYVDAAGNGFRLTVLTPNIEKSEVIRAIICWSFALCVSLILLITLVVVVVVRLSLRPLYHLLGWLDESRDLSVAPPPIEDKRVAVEFSTLNAVAMRYVERGQQQLEQQKEFVANASHEIQTPLAVCTSRLELLLDTQLSEGQMNEVLRVLSTLEHISSLNKSLLLLTKIESGQFHDTRTTNLSQLIAGRAEELSEFYGNRGVVLHVEDRGEFWADMDQTLARILVDNLLKNAFHHNVDGGRVVVQTSPEQLTVANSGSGEPLDGERIFTRFYHSHTREGSSGLGLAIVASVAQLYGFAVEYAFVDGLHTFRIRRNHPLHDTQSHTIVTECHSNSEKNM